MTGEAYVLLSKIVASEDGSRSGWVEQQVRQEAARRCISCSRDELTRPLFEPDDTQELERLKRVEELRKAAFG